MKIKYCSWCGEDSMKNFLIKIILFFRPTRIGYDFGSGDANVIVYVKEFRGKLYIVRELIHKA